MYLSPAGTIFYDNLERNYPRYPIIEDINLIGNEAVSNLFVIVYLMLIFQNVNQFYLSVEFMARPTTLHGHRPVFC